MKKHKIFNKIASVLFILLVISFTSCNDEKPGEYDMTGGVPKVYYVRLPEPASADSLIVGAYMQQTIALIGENLKSVQEIWFNDQMALLNINMVTNNTLIVNVPKTIPDVVTNKIYMVTRDKDTVNYDFRVLIPAPIIGRVVCEHVPAGEEVVVTGDYFFDYPDDPIVIKISGYTVPYEDVVSVEKTRVTFLAPAADVKGSISITTSYGSNTPSYRDVFRDLSGLITSFEDSENGGTGYVPGWGRPDPSQIIEDEYSITGKYVRMAGSISPANDEDGWASGGNNFTINIWSCDNDQNPNSGIPNPMITGDLSTLILKCEVNVLETWSASPMIFAFAAATDNEGWLWADGTQPRAFWAPWTATGSYVSGSWETIFIPLADMKYNGSEVEVGSPSVFGQLGISVHNRGGSSYIGTPCTPVILIDNIRVVSME